MTQLFTAGLTTLLDVVQYRASAASGTADHAAFTYLDDGENVSGTLSYAQLDGAARLLAARLQRICAPGERVLLVYPPCLDYVVAFYACVYAGVIAVPALPPANTRTLPRLRLMAVDARPSLALSLAKVGAGLRRLADAADDDDDVFKNLRWIATDEADDADDVPATATATAAAAWRRPALCASDIVFLQYTSGSTGVPKGVMVSHANVLANVALSYSTYGIAIGDVFVSWLPPHHDFGLIGAIILPLCVAGHSVQFPPAAFLMRPYRWLALIARYRARITGAPNFAYQLCAQRVTEQQKDELDLRCLQIAVNGAERIRPESLQQFAAAFARCGLRPGAMTPAYGMAEAVLLVTASGRRGADEAVIVMRVSKAALDYGDVRAAADPADALDVVSTGMARGGGHRLTIVDPVTLGEAAAGRVGEVWVSGASVARGYWGGRQQENFGATLAGQDGSWLRTGDLGFLGGGQLYVTGRIKEVMIFNGRNVYPQDVELTVEHLDAAFRANACAAFALEEGSTTQLVVVQELASRHEPDTATLLTRLRTELAERHDIVDLAAFLLVKPGGLPRTSSGKIERLRLRQLYLASAIAPRWSWYAADAPAAAPAGDSGPLSDTERRLLCIWKDVFDGAELSTTANFFQLGGHSLAATQLMAAVRAEWHVELGLAALFHAPTPGALAREIDAALSVDALPVGAAPAVAVPPAAAPLAAMPPCATPAPLSFAQQRCWFLDQVEHDHRFYAIALAFNFAGLVEPALMEGALNALIARHAALRTVFPRVDGTPCQRVLPVLSLCLPVTDLGACDEDAAQHGVRQTMLAQTGVPFDLAEGPLLRACLLRLPAERHVLLLTLHHIVYDGRSTGIVLKELNALYAGLSAKAPAALPALPIAYTDYARWENRHFSGPSGERQLAYWRQYLAAAPVLLALPSDRPRPAQIGHRGAAHQCRLPLEEVAALSALAGSLNTTLFSVLAAAMNVLLHRYSGQDDFCIGVMSANRPPEAQALIGNFFNIVPLRARIHGDRRFAAVLGATSEDLLAAYARQVPFELILNHVAAERSAAFTPYAQVVLNFHHESDIRQAAPSWQGGAAPQLSGRHPDDVRHAAFELKLEMHLIGGELDLVFEYNTDLFDAATILRCGAHYRRVLAALCRDPQCRIGALVFLTPEEAADDAAQWRASVRAYPAAACLGALFDAQAARTPQALAVVHEQASYTYQALERRANRLAHLLRGEGVGPDVLVGLHVERSLDMVVGALAVVKAGGAYVPLDPAYPAARLDAMLADARPHVILSHTALRGQLPASAQRVLCLDALGEALACHSDTAPAPLGGPGHLAYVIYTSGSTGRPKGVMVQRQGFVNLLCWFIDQFHLDCADKVLLFSSFSFDLTQKNIFAPLLVGAQLHIPAPGYAPEAARDYIGAQAISLINCAPSAFYPLLLDGGAARMPTLRQVVLGGEAIQAGLIHEAYRALDHAIVIHNSYGPTEASDVVSFHSWNPRQALAAVPIGTAIANTRLYVLDPYLNAVPRGMVGELHIGGDGVGRGYLNLPELTAERFLSDPFADRAGGRMYKSGDLVRQRPDGVLEYLGRNDFQVKIRGFRIELGEIEARLAACPGVREAVVLAREDVPGEQRLVAYLTAQASATLVPAHLRSQLGQVLAAYMVPSAFVVLDAFPSTPNGKLDRQALPAPDRHATPQRLYAAPVGAVEITLASLWQQLLGLERVGRHDDFFELGGHSLLATRLASKIRSAFAVEIALRTVFERPTPAALAEALGGMGASQPSLPPAVPALAHTAAGESALSSAQQGIWFLAQIDSGQAAYNLSYALELRGPLDVAALALTLGEIARRHDVLRSTIVVRDGEPLLCVGQARPLLDVRDLSGAHADARAHALRDAARRPFDLQAGPLARVLLLRLRPERHTLVLTMHHIISDGWSLGVLSRECALLYRAFQADPAASLPPLRAQYADFVRWQRQQVQSGAWEAQAHYWRTQLDGAPAQLALPFDRPRTGLPSQQGALLHFVVAAPATQRLRALVQRAQATLFMGLASVFGLLLSRYCGQDDLCIGTPIANRRHEDWDDLIGFFVNTLVLRLRLDGIGNFSGLLAHVRGVALAAYANQDLPFDHMVATRRRNGEAGRAAPFQVMLALQNAPRERVDFGGATAQPIALENGSAKFDLTLNVTETAGALACSFEYSCDLFDAGTIARMAQNFQVLLDSVIAAPDAALASLAILDAAQRRQLLVDFNATQNADTDDQPIHALFEAQARATPAALALVHEEDRLSYGELNRRANRLAHRLIAEGVGPDVRVAICVERGLDMVVGVLAVLKAGGAYVPLDPLNPPRRLAYMLEDCAPQVLLGGRHVLAQWPAHGALPAVVLAIDDQAGSGGAMEHDPVVAGLNGRHLAYLIYTSGSSGAAKAVMVPHRGVRNLVAAWRAALSGTDVQPVASCWTSFGFDVSVFELFVPLSFGAALHIAPETVRTDPDGLLRWLVERRITLAYLPPFFIRSLSHVADAAVAGLSLAHLLVGVEPLHEQALFRIRRLLPGLRIVNGYGPTEASVYCTSYDAIADLARMAPIGRPLANARIYILDPQGQPVPLGVSGELHIGGVGLARGYLNRPDLTAERFVADPFSADPAARMYKTGDLGRWLADGNIDYQGRNDVQFKIGGYRIEPGEIEAKLAACAGVREAVVIAREDGRGQMRLVAYLTAQADMALHAGELHSKLAADLPPQMIPSAFVVLAAMPMNTNGKLDRTALPAPGLADGAERPFEAPVGEIEIALAAIWCTLLEIERVGRFDHFFALGGHSLTLTKLSFMVTERFGVSLGLAQFYALQEFAQMAAYIARAALQPARKKTTIVLDI